METKERADRDERCELRFKMAAGEPHVYICESREAAIVVAKRVEGFTTDWIRVNTPDLRGHSVHFPRQYWMGCEILPYREAAPAGTTGIAQGPEPAAKPEEPKPAEPEPARDASGARILRATPVGQAVPPADAKPADAEEGA